MDAAIDIEYLPKGRQGAGGAWVEVVSVARIDASLLDAAMTRGYVAAWRWLRDRDAARDALQEAALRALAAQHTYDPARPFYPWFYRILRNHCMDRLRGARREVPLAEPTSGDEAVANPSSTSTADATPLAESTLIAGEEQRAIERAMRRLPEDLREILELRHFQDLSYAEMAEVLDCPKGTVMSRLYRARQALREALLRDPAGADFLDAAERSGSGGRA